MDLTPEQQEVWDLHQQGLSAQKIAEKLGRSRSAIRERLERAKAKQAVDEDPAVTQARNAFDIHGDPDMIWFKDRKYSVRMKIKSKDEQDFLDRVIAATKTITPLSTIKRTTLQPCNEQMVVYPLFDVHLGLLAHAQISGKNVDLESSKREVIEKMHDVMAMTPDASRAVIINGGDFTHQTDDLNQTRRSANRLDVAARNSVTVDAAVEVICTLISSALTKHETVEYYSVPGNHDPQNWETIQFVLAALYRDNPRVKIDVRWDEFSIIEHGDVALFIHHGDKRTPKDLAMFCSASFPEVWGRSKYRMLFTGHMHHLKTDEFPGIFWVQFGAISPRDHHASSHGYLSHRIMSALIFDQRSKRTQHDVLM